MTLDVRLPMGALFLVLGIILALYGLTSDPTMYARHSFGQNVNVIWGGVWAGFGATTLITAFASRRAGARQAASPAPRTDQLR